ncbi:desulfoferrodoxin FeS4 iron-binding domain-containing protein [Methanosarcina sp.]
MEKRHRCEIYGNKVILEKVEGGTLICRGEEMTLVKE